MLKNEKKKPKPQNNPDNSHKIFRQKCMAKTM